MLSLLANMLSGVATASSSTNYTFWLVLDEPECPEELI